MQTHLAASHAGSAHAAGPCSARLIPLHACSQAPSPPPPKKEDIIDKIIEDILAKKGLEKSPPSTPSPSPSPEAVSGTPTVSGTGR